MGIENATHSITFYPFKEEGWQENGPCRVQSLFPHRDHHAVFHHRWIKLQPEQSWNIQTGTGAQLWVVVAGKASLKAQNSVQTIAEGDVIFCPAATNTTLHNDFVQDFVYLEFRYAPLTRWRLIKTLVLPLNLSSGNVSEEHQFAAHSPAGPPVDGPDPIQTRPLQPTAWGKTPYGSFAQAPFSRKELQAEFSVQWLKLEPGMGNDLHNQPLSETYVFLRGEGNVRVGDDQYACGKGDVVFIPALAQHWLRNDTSENVILLAIKYAPFTRRAVTAMVGHRMGRLLGKRPGT